VSAQPTVDITTAAQFNVTRNTFWVNRSTMKSPDPVSRPTRILEAAARLITHYGFDKTTMEDIAHEAGVSKGALYLVWSSKDKLFDALLAFEMKRFLRDFLERMERDPEGGRIANLYRWAAGLAGEPLDVCALHTRQPRLG
jgi:AcrR family transcriptional regulator